MNDLQFEFKPAAFADRKQFEVPAARADQIQSLLTRNGIRATSVLTAGSTTASIEVDGDVAYEAIRVALS
jgi:hypothetical protein